VTVFGAGFDQAGLEQRSKLEGNGAEGDVGHSLVDGTGAEFVAPDETKHFSAARGGQCIKNGGFHEHVYILD
jgi:hypothetical protein